MPGTITLSGKELPEHNRLTTDGIQRILTLDRRMDALQRELEERDRTIQQLRRELDDARCMLARFDRLEIEGFAAVRFLTSRPIRFLNHLGCWFIYPTQWYDHNRIYPNLPEYRSHGRPPLFSRIKDWFRRRFGRRQPKGG